MAIKRQVENPLMPGVEKEMNIQDWTILWERPKDPVEPKKDKKPEPKKGGKKNAR